MVPTKNRSHFYVAVPERGRDYKICPELKVPTSPMFAYSGGRFFVERVTSSSKIRGHLYQVAFLDHCFLVLMALLARAFSPCELATQYLQGHNGCMWAGACGGISFPLLRHMHNFIPDIKV